MLRALPCDCQVERSAVAWWFSNGFRRMGDLMPSCIRPSGVADAVLRIVGRVCRLRCARRGVMACAVARRFYSVALNASVWLVCEPCSNAVSVSRWMADMSVGVSARIFSVMDSVISCGRLARGRISAFGPVLCIGANQRPCLSRLARMALRDIAPN